MTHRTSLLPAAAVVMLAVAIGGLAAQPPAAVERDEQAGAGEPQFRPPIKVGVFVSLLTARQEARRDPKGEMRFWHAGVARRLDDPQVELHAIVDPGTLEDPCVHQAIASQFPAGQRHRLTAGDDAIALSKLDVVVAIRAWSLHDETIDALTYAVEKRGVALIAAGSLGMARPGFTPAVNALNGFDDAEFVCPFDEEVAVEAFVDRILPERAGAGSPVKLKPNGVMGRPRPGTVPLLTLTPESERRVFPDGLPPGKVYYPVALARLGKGRILSCNYPDPSNSLHAAAGGNFYLGAVKQLAQLRRDAAAAEPMPEGMVGIDGALTQ